MQPRIVAQHALTRPSNSYASEQPPVEIEIYEAELRANGWYCRLRIVNLDDVPVFESASLGGQDSFQAVLFAMEQVALKIFTSEDLKYGRLFWLKENGGYGLPLVEQLVDLRGPHTALQVLHVI